MLCSYVTDDEETPQSILVQHIHTLGFELQVGEPVKDAAGRNTGQFKDATYLYPTFEELLLKVGYLQQFYRAGSRGHLNKETELMLLNGFCSPD